MKDLLRKIIPDPLKRWLRSPSAASAPQPSWTYAEDGLCTSHIADFLTDPRFQRAYAAGKSTGSWGTGDLRFRIYTILWAAQHAATLPGDFIECGVYKGGQALAILHYLDWPANRSFYLLDTFQGFPPELLDRAAPVHRHDYQEDCWAEVSKRFAPYPQVKLIRGPIPQTLSQLPSSPIAFLSIDMNCAEPEVAALDHVWPRLVPGGLAVLDDYAFAEPYRRQKDALDHWAKEHNTPILTLPTGQGLIIKS